MAASPNFDQDLVDEILGGDPLITPAEAAAALGIDVLELADRDVPAVRVAGVTRYRASVINRLKEAGPS